MSEMGRLAVWQQISSDCYNLTAHFPIEKKVKVKSSLYVIIIFARK